MTAMMITVLKEDFPMSVITRAATMKTPCMQQTMHSKRTSWSWRLMMMMTTRLVSTALRLKTSTNMEEDGRPTWQKWRHCPSHTFWSRSLQMMPGLGSGFKTKRRAGDKIWEGKMMNTHCLDCNVVSHSQCHYPIWLSKQQIHRSILAGASSLSTIIWKHLQPQRKMEPDFLTNLICSL